MCLLDVMATHTGRASSLKWLIRLRSTGIHKTGCLCRHKDHSHTNTHVTTSTHPSQRLERIRANQARLAELNLVELAQEVSAEINTAKKLKVCVLGWLLLLSRCCSCCCCGVPSQCHANYTASSNTQGCTTQQKGNASCNTILITIAWGAC